MHIELILSKTRGSKTRYITLEYVGGAYKIMKSSLWPWDVNAMCTLWSVDLYLLMRMLTFLNYEIQISISSTFSVEREFDNTVECGTISSAQLSQVYVSFGKCTPN